MCGKVTYNSQREAAMALKAIKKTASNEIPKRAYYCEICNGYHLTKQTKPRY